jgi:hypothetical protein
MRNFRDFALRTRAKTLFYPLKITYKPVERVEVGKRIAKKKREKRVLGVF